MSRLVWSQSVLSRSSATEGRYLLRTNLCGNSRVQDVSAEYTLRGVDPPFLLVDDDLDEIGSALAEDVSRLGPGKLAEMNSGLLEEYLAAQKSYRH